MNSFRELEYISAVAEYRSITKAAEALFISQSAMSHYITKVEKDLGIKLFDRSTNPISLTYAGKCYIDSAKRILLENEQLSKRFKDISQNTIGKLRIGTSRDRSAYMTPELLPRFTELYPGIDVEIFTESGYHLREALREGKIDFLILPVFGDEDLTGIETEKMYEEELLVAARKEVLSEKNLIPGNQKGIDLKTMESIPFYLLSRDRVMRNAADYYFRTAGIKPSIKMEMSSNIACLRMASTGMGAAIIPLMTTRLTVLSDAVELYSIGEKGTYWDVRVLYRKNAYIGKPERDFFSLIQKTFSNESIKNVE